MSLSSEKIDANPFTIGLAKQDAKLIHKMIGVRSGFANMPEQYKEVLILRLLDGLSFKDASLQIGISYEATKSLFGRAISKVRKEMGEE